MTRLARLLRRLADHFEPPARIIERARQEQR